MENISNTAEYLREIIVSRVHQYFPDLSNNINIEVLHKGRPLVRKHSILFEIAVRDYSRQMMRGIFAKIPRVAGEEVTKGIYETMVALHAFSKGLSEEMNIVRPLDYLPERGAILTERVEGAELSALLRHSHRAVEQGNLVGACGRFLCAYHKALGQPTWSTDLAPTFMERCQLYLTRLQDYGVGKARAQHLLTEFERGAARLKGGIATCLTFDDYSVRNIIVQEGNRLFIIEATQPRTKAIYDDLAQFLTSLTMLFWGSPWFFVGRGLRPRLHQQFLSGYFSHHVPLELIALFYAKQLCFTWLRSLDSLAHKQHGIASFIPTFPARLTIHQLFYRLVVDQLQRANVGPSDRACE
jgi:hypothetical protein